MDKFDKLIKDSVAGYEAPYDAQAWANVSAQLGNKGGAMKWIVGSAAAAVLITGGVYLMQDNTENTNTTTQPVENTIAQNNPENNSGTSSIETDVEGTDPVEGTTGTQTEQPANHLNVVHGENPALMNETSHESVSLNPNGGTHPNNGSNTQGTTNTTNPGNETNQGSGEPVEVAVRTNPKFNAELTSACVNSEFVFTPDDLNQNVLYVWDFGDGSFSSSKVGSHIYKRSGTFTVSLSLKDSKTNKTLSKSTVEVTVNAAPTVDFAFEKNSEMIPTVKFINLTEDASTWNWDIKGLKTSADNQFEYTFRKKGTYMVELTAKNEAGCVASVQKPIEIKTDYNLLAPTGFSPDGDGQNDYFMPAALHLMDVDFTMVIYDKGGRVMYQTTDVNNPWDGTNATDNSVAEAGASYVWTVQLKNAKGEIEYYEGQVIIIR